MSDTTTLVPALGPKEPALLENFRTAVDGQPLTSAERRLIVEQARTLIDDVYVHLPQKRAMYGIDASQQLRLLARRDQQGMPEAAFHRELRRIFDGLRDMHTTYIPPEPHRGRALLGFTLERYWDDKGKPHFVVSKSRTVTYQEKIPVGAEVINWNGMPIEVAVRQNAEVEAGGNPAARFARGLESLTTRHVALSPLPAENWVHIEYQRPESERRWWRFGRPAGPETVSCRAEWWVEQSPPLPPEIVGGGSARGLGMSLRTELTREIKTDLLRDTSLDEAVPDSAADGLDRVLKARIVPLPGGGQVGQLRITSFYTEKVGVAGFLAEITRLLKLLPQDGLILDVRGNGGGYIEVAEGLLQLLTDRPITPEPMQFINSPATYDLCGRSNDLTLWRPSIAESGETGTQFSAAFPLSQLSRPAWHYPGRVVLVTDALSYSATDMLAAGFQDNTLGTVLGVDESTGAGGANVWSHGQLREIWPTGPFPPLPRGARLTVAVRRSLRTGMQHGRLLEDFGVRRNALHQMTRCDLLDRNVDLIAYAARLLRERNTWVS
ncbi:S41 family peptidase [Actinoplanes awajinensis]|uniref:Tail specific protease domain-containing protein n=1 Tax=Actinoplanes awajinensis subsp. mycoplanecinus TaxID=135947 RepID=A0A101JLB4_9ACTN|nr:S41 family peptidase [Actinoplanes awajinensis]KUL28476.1 hypothetical protein ADL15_32185 [Actinoplanes awajinensis subsp. mycoplanecinus]